VPFYVLRGENRIIDFSETYEMNYYKDIKFIQSSFEDYSAPLEYFDAIISAQAFHWVSQPLGYEICSKTLKKADI